jgi:hypothetical protein
MAALFAVAENVCVPPAGTVTNWGETEITVPATMVTVAVAVLEVSA